MFQNKTTSFVNTEDLITLTLEIPYDEEDSNILTFIKNKIHDEYALDSSLYFISFIKNRVYLVEKSKVDSNAFDILLPQDIYVEYEDRLNQVPKTANFLPTKKKIYTLDSQSLIYLVPILVILALLLWYKDTSSNIEQKNINIDKLNSQVLTLETSIAKYEEVYTVDFQELEKLRQEYEDIN